MSFLEVITRTYKRPKLLARNQASLAALTSSDCIQSLIVDDVGRGVSWANANLFTFAPHVTGDYVWILDDDDECVLPTLVDELKAIVAEHDPDVIMVRGDFRHNGILPEDLYWEREPVLGHVSVSNYIVRREIWQKYAYAFATRMVYEADFDFIDEVFLFVPPARIYWHDTVAFRVVRRSLGMPGDEGWDA